MVGFACPSTSSLVIVHRPSKTRYGSTMSVRTRTIWRLPGGSDFEKYPEMSANAGMWKA